MDFNEYQKEAFKTALYPERGEDVAYPTLGLVGEAGEVAEKVKKMYRDDAGEITDEKREDIKKELGDVLWYMSELAHYFDFTLEDVAKANIEKLHSRLARGKIGGSGDNR